MVHERFAGRASNEAAIIANAKRNEICGFRDDKNQSFVRGPLHGSDSNLFVLSPWTS
jgi:hypothetical protein